MDIKIRRYLLEIFQRNATQKGEQNLVIREKITNISMKRGKEIKLQL